MVSLFFIFYHNEALAHESFGIIYIVTWFLTLCLEGEESTRKGGDGEESK